MKRGVVTPRFAFPRAEFTALSLLPFIAAVLLVLAPLPLWADAHIADVPFYEQEDYQCGPAALASVLNYWYARNHSGSPVTPDQIAAEIYSPTARGVLGIDLELYAARRGFSVQQRSGDPEVIRDAIDRGLPLIILVDYGFLLYRQYHFMVVTGYAGDATIVHTGRKRNAKIANKDLMSPWKKTDYWSLLITPSS